MEFKLDRWSITEDRCAACRILGGVKIKDEAMARRFLRLPEVSEVTVGTHLVIEPCEGEAVLAYIQETRHRPCPRVELDEANASAASLIGAIGSDHLGKMFDALLSTYIEVEDMDAHDTLELLERVSAAYQDPTIVDLREAAIERATEEAKRKRG